MLNPITMSSNIKQSFIDYITTSFDFADQEYRRQFRKALAAGDAVAKGPFLDIGGSYDNGHSLEELVQEGAASELFLSLEQVPEKEKELKIQRALYRHQEMAFRRASEGNNLIVTTGTGSGKTECFLIPLINQLLRELEERTLTDAVRTIVIYPMNALANDQMKRLRALLKSFPRIRFGLYNGNTEHQQDKAYLAYKKAHDGQEPLCNEVISREEMQRRPPHILITNYSMLEYLLLRPKDDEVFRGAVLRYVVLDEAHIYRGATGIETALLLRRMQARIAGNGNPQYILTSATLGSEAENQQILDFGKQLCGVEFKENCIIRSREKQIPMCELRDFHNGMFMELAQVGCHVQQILAQYHADFSPDGDDAEKLYMLCLHSKLYAALRNAAKMPMAIRELLTQIRLSVEGIDEETLLAFIEVCTKAEKQGSSLIKARYHFFVRALEGAYVTLKAPKELYLHRCIEVSQAGKQQRVFEAAICSHCGRLAVTGIIEAGKLEQHAAVVGDDKAEYYVIKDPEDRDWYNAEDGTEGNEEEDYLLCSVCGACGSDHGDEKKYPCDHPKDAFVRMHHVRKTDAGRAKCPACSNGSIRRFYLGSDAATAVLGTELFEQLPDQEVIVQAAEPERKKGVFGRRKAVSAVRKEKCRQFLCFSDSRSEAAYFANYMEQSYSEFLRRRGIWHIAQKLRDEGRTRIQMNEFVNELTTYFESNRSFEKWDSKASDSAYYNSKVNAWIAVLNELYNARRSTGLISMGVFAPQYRPNADVAQAFAEEYRLSENDALALLNLLIMDAVYTGAIDAGKSVQLSEAHREYIFFSPMQQRLVKVKQSGASSTTSGWCGRKRHTGTYYPNTRMTRLSNALELSEEEADGLLADYWEMLSEGREEVVLDANDFDLVLDSRFWRCRRCGKVTPYNMQGRCASTRCSGMLEAFDALAESQNNHYARLYRSERMKPLFMKEHTAQLSKNAQLEYQEAFVNQKINALSCSTTFEMGVDVGSLETVYMRNVPPNPSNYVQRAGRAGRARKSAAFVLTYSKLSSHDFTYYEHPEDMIGGKISAPVFRLENEKIVRRHIFAVVLSYFLKENPDVYDGDNRAVFLLEGGYEKLKDMLEEPPEEMMQLLRASIPAELHERMGLLDGSWLQYFIGEDGTLELACRSFRNDLETMEKQERMYHRNHDSQEEAKIQKQIRFFRAGKEDHCPKRGLIDFWVRSNVLPKYGFPVDTVELITDSAYTKGDNQALSLSRDLQMAIAEYAPGAEVIADGKVYTSRYIRKAPGKEGESWETGNFAHCPRCEQSNYSIVEPAGKGIECVSCGSVIPKNRWRKTIEPRMGFISDGQPKDVQMHKPERAYKTDDYYVGDPHRHEICSYEFNVNGQTVRIDSTTNDALVVVGSKEYYVCPLCGYADEDEIPDSHKDARGFKCRNENKIYKKYWLSHRFLTDVVKLTFDTEQAADQDVMLSVMFALLEGLSRTMGIERTDIKGCLHREASEYGLIYSLVLYDAVAGGAGHVRRMVTQDGLKFRQVVSSAVDILNNCNCDTSCYRCLRNYYNQKIHDRLSRKAAVQFLEMWTAEPVLCRNGENTQEKEVAVQMDDDEILNDYSNWSELAENYYPDSAMERWDDAGIRYSGEFMATLCYDDLRIDTVVAWPEEKVAVCEDVSSDVQQAFEQCGWILVGLKTKPQKIAKLLKGE